MSHDHVEEHNESSNPTFESVLDQRLIQHPGESTAPNYFTSEFGSHWPDGGVARPRSATIVITRDDGGTIGAD